MDDRIVEAVARAIDPECWQSLDRYCKAKDYGTAEIADAVSKSPRAQDGLAKARAAITVYQAEAWQPISTAPKDGARVLLYPSPYYASNGSVGWFAKKAKDWAYEGETGTGCIPTHWQPLLPAPKASP